MTRELNWPTIMQLLKVIISGVAKLKVSPCETFKGCYHLEPMQAMVEVKMAAEELRRFFED